MKKSHVKTLLKLALVAGLLYFLASKGLLSLKDTQRALADWPRSIPVFAAIGFSTVLGMLRWHLLLRAQGFHLSFWRTCQLTMIGLFFNIALPGAVSGDFVKAYYVGHEVKGQRARAFGAILFDRVAGVSALVLVSATALILGIEHFWGTPFLLAIQLLVGIPATCVLAFYAYLFLVRPHHDPVLRLLRKLEIRLPRIGLVTRTYEGIRHYHHHRGTVIQVLLISMAIHGMVGWSCYQLALALGESNLPLLGFYVVVPLGLLTTAVPVAPAGVGTGHAAFLYLFRLIGSNRGADVFTVLVLLNIVTGALGGLVYLRFRAHEPAPALPGAQPAPAEMN